MPDPIVTLTTDFGTLDGYVAAMKGVILSINPLAQVIDVTHDIAPQSVEQAAFVTSTAWPYFPPRTIHVCIVDPGVGTDRKAIVVQTERGVFVGPDNGALSAALSEESREQARHSGRVALPARIEAYELANPSYMLSPVSATFHGRDIFAPAAAHLSLGVLPAEFGPRLPSMAALPPFRARAGTDGTLEGRVIHTDRFGNLITSVREADLPARFAVEVCGQHIAGPSRTFADAAGLLAFLGSYGYLAIAMRDGSAALVLSAGVGERVVVRPG